ncbi:MAG: hypothetical protein M1492_08310 [Gammaproteobacteria bacterium]|jgi:hypothetical protein|nr:hypothetical protein [Gammaproteobacteria bacterium]
MNNTSEKDDDINPFLQFFVTLIMLLLLGIMISFFSHGLDGLIPNTGYRPISINTFDRLSTCQKGIVQAAVKQSGQPADENVLKAANWICEAVATDRILLKKVQNTGGSPYLIRAYQAAIRLDQPAVIVDQLDLNAHNFSRTEAAFGPTFKQKFDWAYGMYLPDQIQHRYRQHLKRMERKAVAAAEQ